MQTDQQLLKLERQFWLSDVDFYRQNLTDDAWMVFAEPVGTLSRDEILDTISAGPRWSRVELDEVYFLRLSDQAVLMSYRAMAMRDAPREVASKRSSHCSSSCLPWQAAPAIHATPAGWSAPRRTVIRISC